MIVSMIVMALHVGGLMLLWRFVDVPLKMIRIGGAMVQSIYFFYFAFALFTYTTIIAVIILSSRRNPTSRTSCASSTTTSSRLDVKIQSYAIPLLITLTYMVFVCVPQVVLGICARCDLEDCTDLMYRVWSVTRYLDNIPVALIYIFCDRDVLMYLRNILVRKTQSGSGNRTSQVTSTTEV